MADDHSSASRPPSYGHIVWPHHTADRLQTRTIWWTQWRNYSGNYSEIMHCDRYSNRRWAFQIHELAARCPDDLRPAMWFVSMWFTLFNYVARSETRVFFSRSFRCSLLPLDVYSGFTPAATPVVVCTRMLLIVIIGNRVDWLPAECLTKYFSNYWNQSFALEGLIQTGRPLEPR